MRQYIYTFTGNTVILTIYQNQKDYNILFDKELFDIIKDKYWRLDKKGYCYYVNSEYKVIHLHRFITNCPKGLIVHHVNHNPLDNRISNLKIMTISEHSHLHNPKN